MKSEIQVKQVFSSFSAFKKCMRMAKLENLIENAGFDKFVTRAERFSQVLSHLLSETVERCFVRSRVVEHHDIVALRSELGIDLQSGYNRS